MIISVKSVTTRGYLVPLTLLGTSAAVVRAVPLLLIDLLTDEGVTGRAYLFCYTASGARAIAGHVHEAIDLVAGTKVEPLGLSMLLARRYTLLGVTGTVRMAMSGIDMALWDAQAITGGMPLATLLGGTVRPIAAYDSRGLGLMDPKNLADEVGLLLSAGLKAVKVRLGYPTLAEDIAAVRAVRSNVSDEVRIMVDYNQALTRTEAILRGRALDDEGIVWIEEPIRHDDYRGSSSIAAELRTPISLGENFNGPEALVEALAAAACDVVMPDAARIGGVTGWMQAAGIAAGHGIEMSSHLMPEISAHLLAVSPTARWLEYVDWANAFLQEPLAISDGAVTPSDIPGSGMTWDESRLRRLEAL